MIAVWLAVLLALVTVSPLAAQETVVTGISKDNIALTADFNGSEIFIFGAIRREGPAQPDVAPLDIIITIKGPTRGVTVRRKDRRFGIWVNTDAVRVREAPTFYSIATTSPLDSLLTETELLRYQIGMNQAVRRVGGHPTITDTSSFGEAVVRIREKEGLYSVRDGAVSVAEDTLFQARFELPANLTEGIYSAEFFLVRNHEVISSGVTDIVVEKTGLERWMFNLSRNEPLTYGILSVLLALAAGWLAAATFRLLKR
ncbi:MAG TPA: TIGR02186 family protein [Amaricoccus sp.]|uniref:TIGR02186 family protein n=1 Tax=Amaricoccus sp. TaxID=1872485 RepID=UPI002CB505E2|nr:TIGR02186 family protein [Amaricoccus sp.]HMQ92106.1 TIGR02186 family protein [Amaricoccus sp.]HMR50877.1 TIGR02186 family protein [Amaricoccus sp.]HMR60204.1 TIGR02186 family protein [Amaricoccus sp.]HMT97944.1 TIGR02186 family protein [Amaricoccus sp.]